jgi:hypothetical protein
VPIAQLKKAIEVDPSYEVLTVISGTSYLSTELARFRDEPEKAIQLGALD